MRHWHHSCDDINRPFILPLFLCTNHELAVGRSWNELGSNIVWYWLGIISRWPGSSINDSSSCLPLSFSVWPLDRWVWIWCGKSSFHQALTLPVPLLTSSSLSSFLPPSSLEINVNIFPHCRHTESNTETSTLFQYKTIFNFTLFLWSPLLHSLLSSLLHLSLSFWDTHDFFYFLIADILNLTLKLQHYLLLLL